MRCGKSAGFGITAPRGLRILPRSQIPRIVLLPWTQSRRLFKDIEQSFGAKDALAPGCAYLLDNFHLGKASQGCGCRVVSDSELTLGFAHRDEWIRGEEIKQAQYDG